MNLNCESSIAKSIERTSQNSIAVCESTSGQVVNVRSVAKEGDVAERTTEGDSIRLRGRCDVGEVIKSGRRSGNYRRRIDYPRTFDL